MVNAALINHKSGAAIGALSACSILSISLGLATRHLPPRDHNQKKTPTEVITIGKTYLIMFCKKFSFPKIKIWFEPTFCARERTRTSTPLRAPAPQAGLSTGFSTRAYIFYSFLPSILRAFSIFKRFRDKQTIPLL